MTEKFEDALKLILQMEGGKVDLSSDPGGRTNQGVTQRTYDAWRAKQGLASRDVYDIAASEVSAIYRQEYADKVRFDDLPAGLTYAVLDYAVNSGTGRASKALQILVGVPADGVIGPMTIAAVKAMSSTALINSLCDGRLKFLQALPTWPTFGKGWTSRVAFVRKNALAMASAPIPTSVAYQPPAVPNPREPAVAKPGFWARFWAAFIPKRT